MARLDKRLLICFFSGFLFAAAWVVFGDGFTFASRKPADPLAEQNKPFSGREWAPPLVGSIALLMVNMVGPKDLSDDSVLEEPDATLNKAWFFFSVMVTITSIVLGIVFYTDTYANLQADNSAPGINLMLTPIILAVSSGVLFYSRRPRVEEF